MYKDENNVLVFESGDRSKVTNYASLLMEKLQLSNSAVLEVTANSVTVQSDKYKAVVCMQLAAGDSVSVQCYTQLNTEAPYNKNFKDVYSALTEVAKYLDAECISEINIFDMIALTDRLNNYYEGTNAAFNSNAGKFVVALPIEGVTHVMIYDIHTGAFELDDHITIIRNIDDYSALVHYMCYEDKAIKKDINKLYSKIDSFNPTALKNTGIIASGVFHTLVTVGTGAPGALVRTIAKKNALKDGITEQEYKETDREKNKTRNQVTTGVVVTAAAIAGTLVGVTEVAGAVGTTASAATSVGGATTVGIETATAGTSSAASAGSTVFSTAGKVLSKGGQAAGKAVQAGVKKVVEVANDPKTRETIKKGYDFYKANKQDIKGTVGSAKGTFDHTRELMNLRKAFNAGEIPEEEFTRRCDELKAMIKVESTDVVNKSKSLKNAFSASKAQPMEGNFDEFVNEGALQVAMPKPPKMSHV